MDHSLNQKITVGSIFKFTLPSIIMMIFMSLYTMVDGVFVSRLINTDALSAVNSISINKYICCYRNYVWYWINSYSC